MRSSAGRALARQQSYATGAIALATLVAIHRGASLLRFNRIGAKLFDHRIRVLARDGKLRRRELRLCGLTDEDVYAHLRQHGVFDLGRLRYVLYESKGSLTLVDADVAAGSDAPLVAAAVDNAPGYP